MPENEPIDLKELQGKEITVSLKGGRKIRGTLSEFDDYMNLLLKDVVEIKNGEETERKHQFMVVKGGNTRTILL